MHESSDLREYPLEARCGSWDNKSSGPATRTASQPLLDKAEAQPELPRRHLSAQDVAAHDRPPEDRPRMPLRVNGLPGGAGRRCQLNHSEAVYRCPHRGLEHVISKEFPKLSTLQALQTSQK